MTLEVVSFVSVFVSMQAVAGWSSRFLFQIQGGEVFVALC